MESVASWIASHCDEVLQLDDRDDATLGDALAAKGVRVIRTSPQRGLNASFALQTYHPQNVLGVELDDETFLEALNCISVERIFHIPAFEADWPAGWRAEITEYGLLVERCG